MQLSNIVFPTIFRDWDWNIDTGLFKWETMDTKYDNYKAYKTSAKILHIPPSFYTGFSTFTKSIDWWKQGLTLETWNDEYVKNFLEDYYQKIQTIDQST